MIFFICFLSATQESDLIPLKNTIYSVNLEGTSREITGIIIPSQNCDLKKDTSILPLRNVKKTSCFRNVFCGNKARNVYFGFLSLLILISLVFIVIGMINRGKYYFTMFGLLLWPMVALLTWVVIKFHHKK